MAGYQVDQNDFAALRLDQFAADHLLHAIIAALHKHLRADALNQIQRRVFREDHHQIDRLERGEHLGAGMLVLNWAALAL